MQLNCNIKEVLKAFSKLKNYKIFCWSFKLISAKNANKTRESL